VIVGDAILNIEAPGLGARLQLNDQAAAYGSAGTGDWA
jgi:hypothetical protein